MGPGSRCCLQIFIGMALLIYGHGCRGIVSSQVRRIHAEAAITAVGQVHLMRYYEDFLNALGMVSWHWYSRQNHGPLYPDSVCEVP